MLLFQLAFIPHFFFSFPAGFHNWVFKGCYQRIRDAVLFSAQEVCDRQKLEAAQDLKTDFLKRIRPDTEPETEDSVHKCWHPLLWEAFADITNARETVFKHHEEWYTANIFTSLCTEIPKGLKCKLYEWLQAIVNTVTCMLLPARCWSNILLHFIYKGWESRILKRGNWG